MSVTANQSPRARLIAIRAALGYATWAAFYRATGLDDATAVRWLGGFGVRPAFVERFAVALNMSTSRLCELRQQIVDHEHSQKDGAP